MTVLYLRIPDELDRALRDLAAAERRSVNSQAIVLLERAVRDVEAERRADTMGG